MHPPRAAPTTPANMWWQFQHFNMEWKQMHKSRTHRAHWKIFPVSTVGCGLAWEVHTNHKPFITWTTTITPTISIPILCFSVAFGTCGISLLCAHARLWCLSVCVWAEVGGGPSTVSLFLLVLPFSRVCTQRKQLYTLPSFHDILWYQKTLSWLVQMAKRWWSRLLRQQPR